jgi:hypothetical protein
MDQGEGENGKESSHLYNFVAVDKYNVRGIECTTGERDVSATDATRDGKLWNRNHRVAKFPGWLSLG